MSADDISPDDQWPLPPAWMWDCTDCVRLYEAMKHVQDVMAELQLTGERGVDWDFMDSVPGTQIRLSMHLATTHTDFLPDWDAECGTCTLHQEALERDKHPSSRLSVEKVAAEHRARHVFAPPRIVGLM